MTRILTLIVLGVAAFLTAVFPHWIESVLGVDPDAGSGAIELALYALLALAVILVLASLARDWRGRSRPRR